MRRQPVPGVGTLKRTFVLIVNPSRLKILLLTEIECRADLPCLRPKNLHRGYEWPLAKGRGKFRNYNVRYNVFELGK
jgi:hypothetical protein